MKNTKPASKKEEGAKAPSCGHLMMVFEKRCFVCEKEEKMGEKIVLHTTCSHVGKIVLWHGVSKIGIFDSEKDALEYINSAYDGVKWELSKEDC